MNDILKGLGILVLGLVLVAAVGFGLNLAGFESFKFFAPKVEQVRYDTFKESQAFNEGTLRELFAYKTQYAGANPGQRMAMRGAILHEFSTYPKEKLPAELRQFYTEVEVNGGAQ